MGQAPGLAVGGAVEKKDELQVGKETLATYGLRGWGGKLCLG